MCEWLAFLMLVFGCDMCDVDCQAVLAIGSCSGSGCNVELINTCPVRGLQFTINGAQPVEVRTTARSEGFFAQFNKENGKVIVLSLSGNKISPGVGTVLIITFGNSGSASISGVKIVF